MKKCSVRFSMSVCLLASACLGLASSVIAQGKNRPAELYLDFMLGDLSRIEGDLSHISEIAETTAGRLVAGGKLYICGSQGGFASEGCGRAGGLMLLKAYRKGMPLSPQDTVLLGTVEPSSEQDIALAKAIREKKAVVIVFAPSARRSAAMRENADHFIDSFTPANDAIISAKGIEGKICPTAAVANVTNLWVFTGELVSALTRKGKMPTMFQSVMIEGSRERNKRLRKNVFHADLKLAQIEKGALGRQYIRKIRKHLNGVKKSQLPQFTKAGELVAGALENDHEAYCTLIGHFLPHQVGVPGDPRLLKPFPSRRASADQIKTTMKKGDVLFYVGYTAMPDSLLQAAREIAAKTICVVAGAEGKELDHSGADIYIDPQWKLGDAAVTVPGYDVRILPPSGVVQMMTYWMLVGEAASAAKAD